MKRFTQTFRDVLVILLLAIVGLMIGGIWLDSWEINRFVLPMHFFFGPIIEFTVFCFGFRLLKRKFMYDENETVFFPPVFHIRYFYYAFGLLGLCGIGSIVVGGQFAFPKMDEYLFSQNVASLLGVCIIAPIVEEIVFRVVILNQIAKRYNLKSGIIISSLLFGAVHLMNGGLDLFSAIQLIVSGTLMGMLLSLIYLKENSVWACFTVHALYNGIGSIIPTDIKIVPDWPIQFILESDNALITGGQYGIDCSLMNIIAYIIMIVIILVLIRKKERE